MANKMPVIEVFMTLADEELFSQKLSTNIPCVNFINSGTWEKRTPDIGVSLDKCLNCSPQHSIWNSDILPLKEYEEKFIFPDANAGGYFGATIGRGLIQYIRPQKAGYDSYSLLNGRLAASYDQKQDPETDLYVKTVWKLFKNNAKKVYAIDRKTGEISSRPETRFFAWPDAAKKYRGKEGRYLTNNAMAYFIVKE
ncbi:hypothetical protein HM25_002489 [Salmonella enterica subsp. enterica serovar Carno]|nr:hypothetical protein [Salmonella enterica]EDV0457371.1 hypothetical protein [Salmonella enterica subsp. enterica]EDV9642766.1 hypothetical protein [Salmonella enterica subsp. enterica serovar Carno]ECJ6058507.1 hypothetical protein [Salmonella enterica]ECJ6175529.1 hypothetical protein [Salmonella enterica]